MSEIRTRLGIRGPRAATSADGAQPAPKTCSMNAAARKRIGEATRKRWAALKKAKDAPAKAEKPKRKMSAGGRARIVAATKQRGALSTKSTGRREEHSPERDQESQLEKDCGGEDPGDSHGGGTGDYKVFDKGFRFPPFGDFCSAIDQRLKKINQFWSGAALRVSRSRQAPQRRHSIWRKPGSRLKLWASLGPFERPSGACHFDQQRGFWRDRQANQTVNAVQ